MPERADESMGTSRERGDGTEDAPAVTRDLRC